VVGRRWSKFAVATLALAAALLAAAPAASAAEEPETRPFDAFALQGSNGYRIFVFGIFHSGYGESGEVGILVRRKGSAAFYVAPALVTDAEFKADLGFLGEIDVVFRSSGKKGVAHPDCAPKQRIVYDKGTYVGTIEFRGEEGYTQVDTDRARFLYGSLASIGCSYSITSEVFGRDLPGIRLKARSRIGAGNLAMQANQGHPGARVRVTATISEKRGRIRISRGVEQTYPARALEFAPDLRFAALRPDAPFSGTGTFRRGAKQANRWSGNLSVDFPGRANVSLTGTRFHASLRHSRLVKETRSPERRSRPRSPQTR
jgi:hypothetical protein